MVTSTLKLMRLPSSSRKRLWRLQGLRLRLLSPLQSKSSCPSPHSLLLTTIGIRLWPDAISVQRSSVFVCTFFLLLWPVYFWGEESKKKRFQVDLREPGYIIVFWGGSRF